MNALFGCFQETYLILYLYYKDSSQCIFYTWVLGFYMLALEVILKNAMKVLEIAKKETLKPHVLDEIEVRDPRTNLENKHEFERS